jgi:Zn-dependent protease with chaperone function
MLTDVRGGTFLLVLIAIAPALVCWVQGAYLKALVDDPAIAERLMAARQRNGAMLGAVLVLLIAASTADLAWTLPLLGLSLIVASYPLRRAMFRETWSLASYVGFMTRLFVAVWGFWIALAVMPMLAVSAGSSDWLAGAAVAAGLFLWNARYAAVVRYLLRSRPIDDPALLVRFNELVQRSGIVMPRFERVDLHGGAIANALALPSLRSSAVVFTETLLDRLQPDETVAICAHELAHLEHFNPQRLQQINRVNLLLIGCGAALVPLARLAGAPSAIVPQVLWLIAVVASMAWRVRDRQRHETESDVRAVALCGNAEALISGLTCLYSMGRMPRRLDAVTEQRATHPSLARRIRDIRAAAGTIAARLDAPASFTGADGQAVVTFEENTLRWAERDGAVHSFSYTHLVELRLEVRGRRPPNLIALERTGRRWTLSLVAEDLPRAQAVLDVVDAQLPALGPPRAVWPQLARAVLALFALIGVLVGQAAMAFVTLLAVIKPSAPLVAAAGVAWLASGALIARYDAPRNGAMTELALVVGLLGLLLLYVARSKREKETPRSALLPAALLALCAAASTAAVALGGLDPVRLHQSARAATGAPVLLLALAGALTLWRSRIAQYAAIPVIIVAAATTLAASSTFLDRFGHDPFLVSAEPLTWRSLPQHPQSEFVVPSAAGGLQLSRSGEYVAVHVRRDDSDPDSATAFYVGRPGGTLTPVEADQLTFLDDDDDGAVLARSDDEGVELTQIRAGAPGEVSWRLHVPDIIRDSLSIDVATRRWRVIGWDRRRRHIVRAEGLLGTADVRRTQWSVANAGEGWIQGIAAAGDDVLFIESRSDAGLLQRYGLWEWAWMLGRLDSETRFRAASAGGLHDVALSQLDAQCRGAVLAREGLLCSAFDGTRTRVIAMDPASKRISGLTVLDGHFVSFGSPPGEWLSGWRDNSPVALNLNRREAFQLDVDCKDRVFQIAPATGVAGTIAQTAGSATVKIYRTD